MANYDKGRRKWGGISQGTLFDTYKISIMPRQRKNVFHNCKINRK